MMKIESSVNLIYEYCRDNNLKMLSNFDGDFWEVYRDNSEYFDRLFWRSYKSFIAFSLIEEDDVESVVTEYAIANGIESAMKLIVSGIIFMNFLPELLLNIIVSPGVAKTVSKIKRD